MTYLRKYQQRLRLFLFSKCQPKLLSYFGPQPSENKSLQIKNQVH